MKGIATLYIDYLERALISMVLATLVLTVVSGFAYGGRGRIPATLAVVTLGLIVCVAIGRRPVVREHPEFKTKLFGEIRLFWFMLQRRILRLTSSSNLNSRKQGIQQAVSRGIAIMVVVLGMWTLWSSFSISADIAHLKRNEAIAGARPGIPATFFDKVVAIEVLQVLDGAGPSPKVTGIIRSEGYPELKFESEGVGYTTNYVGPEPFRIRIIGVRNSTVQFFVERLDGPVAR